MYGFKGVNAFGKTPISDWSRLHGRIWNNLTNTGVSTQITNQEIEYGSPHETCTTNIHVKSSTIDILALSKSANESMMSRTC